MSQQIQEESGPQSAVGATGQCLADGAHQQC
jgi:hypothetical protein